MVRAENELLYSYDPDVAVERLSRKIQNSTSSGIESAGNKAGQTILSDEDEYRHKTGQAANEKFNQAVDDKIYENMSWINSIIQASMESKKTGEKMTTSENIQVKAQGLQLQALAQIQQISAKTLETQTILLLYANRTQKSDTKIWGDFNKSLSRMKPLVFEGGKK